MALQRSVSGHLLQSKNWLHFLSRSTLPLPPDSSICGKSPWAQCHVLTLIADAHTHTYTQPHRHRLSLPLHWSPYLPVFLSFSPSLLSSLSPPPLTFLVSPSRSPSPPVLISQCVVRAVEDGEARPSQKTFHYLFSSHLPHWEQRWRATEKKAKETKRGGKQKQQLNKMGERLKPVRRLIDKSCFRSHLFLKVWGFDVDMCERQIEGKRNSWDRVCVSEGCVFVLIYILL